MARMKRQHEALRQIVGECDSMLFHTRPNMGYRGLDATALRDGIEIIRRIATAALRQAHPRRRAAR
jgi:hypothetical protein